MLHVRYYKNVGKLIETLSAIRGKAWNIIQWNNKKTTFELIFTKRWPPYKIKSYQKDSR